MKKSDIAMIILIAVASVMIAFFVTRGLLGDSASEAVEVDVIDEISSEITPVDPKIFNSQAINPAVEVQIEGTGQ